MTALAPVLPDLTPGGRLARIRVAGAYPAALTEANVSGQLTVSMSEVTTLELVAADPDLELLASGLLAVRTPVTYGPLDLIVESREITDAGGVPTLTVEAMSAGAQKARRERGELVRRDISPSGYVAIGAAAVGLRAVTQPTPTRTSITRAAATKGQPGETEYDVWQRLAGEVGFVCFEVAGVVYFAHPTWLVTRLPRVRVDWRGDDRVLTLPTCREQTNDSTQPVTVDLSVTDSLALALLPGFAADLVGVPTFDRTYLVTAATIPLDDAVACTVNTATPVDPTATGDAAAAALKTKPAAATKPKAKAVKDSTSIGPFT